MLSIEEEEEERIHMLARSFCLLSYRSSRRLGSTFIVLFIFGGKNIFIELFKDQAGHICKHSLSNTTEDGGIVGLDT